MVSYLLSDAVKFRYRGGFFNQKSGETEKGRHESAPAVPRPPAGCVACLLFETDQGQRNDEILRRFLKGGSRHTKELVFGEDVEQSLFRALDPV